MLAIISLVIILTLSISVTKIATIVLKHTGLSEQAAKFQARSAFTGVGFTTKESEKVVNHPARRKTLMVLMLLGNMGIVTSVSSLLMAFVGQEDNTSTALKVVLIVLVVVFMWTLASSRWAEKGLSMIVERFLSQYSSLEIKDYASLLHLEDDYRILEQAVRGDLWICGKKLRELRLWEEGILLLGIKKPNGDFIGAPTGECIIEDGDDLTIYGHIKKLEKLADREYGIHGDFEHKKAKLERGREVKKQESEKS